MHIGLTMFATDYAIQPHDLAREAEARGLESLWLPEHSHIPTSRKSPWPGGPELPKYYTESYDPFASIGSPRAASCSASAPGGTPRKWPITAPRSRRASSGCASASWP